MTDEEPEIVWVQDELSKTVYRALALAAESNHRFTELRDLCDKLSYSGHFTPVQIAEIGFFLGQAGFTYDKIVEHLPKFLKWYAARANDSVAKYSLCAITGQEVED